MARPRTHDDAVRRRLLDASSQIIAQHGADALSVRKVATAAETTTAAVYSLFGSREALITAVVSEGFRRFAAHLARVQPTEDPGEDLLALGRAYRANALDNPHFYQVMFSGLNHQGDQTPGAETFDILVEAVARAGQRDGAVARIRAQRIWAYVHGLISLELAGLIDTSSTPDRAEEAYLASLRAAAPVAIG